MFTIILMATSYVKWIHSNDFYCEISNENGQMYQDCPLLNNFKNQPQEISESRKYPDGTLVLAHYYMDEFLEEFGVVPLYFSEIEPSVTDLLSKTNLTDTLDKFSKKKNISKYERSLLIDLEINSRKFVPLIQEIEARLTNGTFIDDRMLYVRWVDDYMGYGLFAGRDLKSGDLIGIYNGVYSRAISDAEYGILDRFKMKFIIHILKILQVTYL
ncbi:hypothetical protein G9A89_010920 [Geosiphon pyriformis]|nr:hypothetical protein G9A89_010920 [Geosiphon pyriformis]